jgi:altronate dehydratase small subunit
MHSQKELIIMDLEDNIGFIKQDVLKGQKINIQCQELEDLIDAKEDIPFGFKIALRNISQGEKIYKFGEAIGIASVPITKGEMVHVHNVEGLRGRGDLSQ